MGKKKIAAQQSAKPGPQSGKGLWTFLLIIKLGLGVGLATIFSLNYVQAHALLRRLTFGRELASLTETIFAAWRPWVLGVGGLLLAAGILQLAWMERSRQRAAQTASWLGRQTRRLPEDFGQLWHDARPARADWPDVLVVLALMGAALLVRWLFLSYPMRYDESYTVVTFASRPWLNLISDYSLPNNHIFHTILVKLSIGLFGDAPWAVRLPAFISGILCIPAGYVLARQLYGRTTALLSAGLISLVPMLIEISTNARGYSQYTLFGLLLFSLGIYLVRHANLAGWLLFGLVSTLGFYTVPFMLYPFGAVCLWMLVSVWIERERTVYGTFGRFLKYLVSMGVLVVVVAVLLYSPVILIGTGLQSLIGNPFVTPMSWTEFWPVLGEEMLSTWQKWNFDLTVTARFVLAGGVILSLALHRRISRVRMPLQLTSLLWLAAVVIPMRRNPYDRLWVFLLPLWLTWASAGLLGLFSTLKEKPRLVWQNALTIGILVLSLTWSYQRVHDYFPGWQADPGKVEEASTYLSQALQPGDAVAVVFPFDAQYWYYLGRLGVADEVMHRIEQTPHARVFAVVTDDGESSPASVLAAHQLDPLDYPVDQAVQVFQTNDQIIYICPHR